MQIRALDLTGPVDAFLEFGDAPCIQVKSDDRNSRSRKRYRDRQPDISKPNNRNLPAVRHIDIPGVRDAIDATLLTPLATVWWRPQGGATRGASGVGPAPVQVAGVRGLRSARLP